MFCDFYVTHGHPDFRVTENLLQDRDIGPGQNRSGGECVTQVVEVHYSAHSHVLADAVMGFADGTKVLTGLSGTRKNPVLVGIVLSALFQEIKYFLAHRESSFGVPGLATHDQDSAVREVEILIGHPENFIGPHALAEHDDGDALKRF